MNPDVHGGLTMPDNPEHGDRRLRLGGGFALVAGISLVEVTGVAAFFVTLLAGAAREERGPRTA